MNAAEIFKVLIKEKQGQLEHHEKAKAEECKAFLKQTLNTDNIEAVQLEDLKRVVEGDKMISRIQYRR